MVEKGAELMVNDEPGKGTNMDDIKILRQRWHEKSTSGTNNDNLTYGEYINIILLAHRKVKIKDIAAGYNQTIDSITELVETARKERVLPVSPFSDKNNGLSDYRGFPLKEQLVRLEMADVDFSYTICEWAGSLNACKVKTGQFVRTNFDGRFFGDIFEKCNFDQGSFINGAFGSSIFIDCSFISTNLTATAAQGAKFIRCSFKRTNMKKAHFFKCVFEECDFEKTLFHDGSLAGSEFITNRPSDSQLGNTIL